MSTATSELQRMHAEAKQLSDDVSMCDEMQFPLGQLHEVREILADVLPERLADLDNAIAVAPVLARLYTRLDLLAGAAATRYGFARAGLQAGQVIEYTWDHPQAKIERMRVECCPSYGIRDTIDDSYFIQGIRLRTDGSLGKQATIHYGGREPMQIRPLGLWQPRQKRRKRGDDS